MNDAPVPHKVTLIGPCPVGQLGELLYRSDRADAAALHHPMAGSVAELAGMLIDHGHHVHVVTTQAHGIDRVRELTGPGLTVHLVPRRRPRQALADLYRVETRQMADLVNGGHPDIVHAHWSYEGQLAAAAAKEKVPTLTTARDAPLTILRHDPDAYRIARTVVAARARPTITHLSTPSPDLARSWRREMRYRRSIRVIPNAIPRDIEIGSHSPAPEPVILDLSSADHHKNAAGLLRAFAVTRRSVPQARLHLAGFGLESDSPMAHWAERQNLASGVHFLGPLGRAEVAEQMRAAWLLAHSALEESFGNTVLEALATGTPVIAGAHSGALPWVLGEGTLTWLRNSPMVHVPRLPPPSTR